MVFKRLGRCAIGESPPQGPGQGFGRSFAISAKVVLGKRPETGDARGISHSGNRISGFGHGQLPIGQFETLLLHPLHGAAAKSFLETISQAAGRHAADAFQLRETDGMRQVGLDVVANVINGRWSRRRCLVFILQAELRQQHHHQRPIQGIVDALQSQQGFTALEVINEMADPLKEVNVADAALPESQNIGALQARLNNRHRFVAEHGTARCDEAMGLQHGLDHGQGGAFTAASDVGRQKDVFHTTKGQAMPADSGRCGAMKRDHQVQLFRIPDAIMERRRDTGDQPGAIDIDGTGGVMKLAGIARRIEIEVMIDHGGDGIGELAYVTEGLCPTLAKLHGGQDDLSVGP